MAFPSHALCSNFSARRITRSGEKTSSEFFFLMLKLALTLGPVLAISETTKPTVLSTDASSFGVGAAHRHKQRNGEYRPVASASITLSKKLLSLKITSQVQSTPV